MAADAVPPQSPRPTRALSGIQPTGRFHWGNYFGAIRQYIDLQPAVRGGSDEAYYFIADLHALTTIREPDRLRQLVHDAAVDLVALGLDPERATLFVQSDVPEVTELSWLLMTVTPMGLLERCHAYKDKKSRGLPADAGLFTRCSTSRSAATWPAPSTISTARSSRCRSRGWWRAGPGCQAPTARR
jgi:tryptophanyl-tRNA synthetase